MAHIITAVSNQLYHMIENTLVGKCCTLFIIDIFEEIRIYLNCSANYYVKYIESSGALR